MKQDKVLTVANSDQKTLFVHELMGQISDGKWENTRPYNHYRPWCECEVVVGPKVGRNFYAEKSNYNFSDRGLISIVGDRMINQVKLARLGVNNDDISYMDSLDWSYSKERVKTDGCKYYKEKVAKYKKYFKTEKEMVAKIDAIKYDYKDLVKDLNALKSIIKIKNFNY